MLRLPRPRRFLLCGVPVTYELVLRLVLLGATVGALVAASIPKVKSILQQANVVSVSMTDSSRIPAPGVLVCGGLMDICDVQMVSRGRVYANGTVGPEIVRQVPSELVQIRNATDLNLRANGDWPTDGKCVILQPEGLYFAKNINGTDDDSLNTIVFVAQSKNNFTAMNDVGLSIAMWDGDVPMEDQQPIWTGIPSINTLTFVYSEHLLLHKDTPQTHYTLQKQNLRTMQPAFFGNQKVIGKIVISPDTFFVTRYIDRPSYTWVDLAGAIGGMASIALAVWIFLFGSGKYKSWGVMQRYVLRTSPNSSRYRDVQASPKNPFDAAKLFVQKQISRLDSSADHELDHVPQDRRRLSSQQRYSTVMNMHAAATVAAAMGGASVGGKLGTKTASATGGGEVHSTGFEPNTSRYSMDSSGPSNYYFSDQGTPGSQSLQPLAPINENEDDAEEQVSELIRLIDLRMDERMWSLERTLARYYLDGFRLRNYSTQYNVTEGSRFYPDMDDERQTGGIDSMGLGEGARVQNCHSKMELLQSHPNSIHLPVPAPPTPPTPPSYPPRPQLVRPYDYLNQSYPVHSGTESQSREDRSLLDPSPPSSYSGNSNRTLQDTGFPHRRDMRGTIRKAVERLQNEWPQSRQIPLPTTYVPRTQYQSSASNNNGAGGPGGNANYTGVPNSHSDGEFRQSTR